MKAAPGIKATALAIMFCAVSCAADFFSLAAASSGSEITVSRAIRLIQKRYDSIRDITASFVQETYSPGVYRPVVSSGTVYFKRPEMMRWEYEKPEPQVVVTGSADVFVYEEEAAQVMVLPRSRFLSSEISRAFFLGKGSLDHFFRVTTDRQCNLDGKWCLRLFPKKKSGNLQEVRIVADPRTHLIREVWIKDELGGRTHISFGNIKINSRLPDSLFRFRIPPGVDVYTAGED